MKNGNPELERASDEYLQKQLKEARAAGNMSLVHHLENETFVSRLTPSELPELLERDLSDEEKAFAEIPLTARTPD